MWTSGKKECTNIIKGIVFKKIVSLVTFKWPLLTPGLSEALFYPV